MCDHCAACQKEGPTVECRLCGDAVVSYCDARCAQNHWAEHADVCNVVHVDDRDALVAAPYAYQDVLDGKYFAASDHKLLAQTYSLHHADAAGTIASRIQAPVAALAGGKSIPVDRYVVYINGQAATRVSNGKTDTIEARAPGAAGRQAAQRTPTTRKTLWSPLLAPVEIDLDAPLEVAVEDAATGELLDVATIVFPANLERHYSLLGAGVNRRARAPIVYQLQEKKLGACTSVLPVAAHNAASGTTVRLALDVSDRERVRVADVEYVLPTKTGAVIPAWQEQRFHCDVNDVDHVTGLLAALGEHISEVRATNPTDDALVMLDRDYATIHDHLQAMHADEVQASPLVNSAVNRSVQTLFVGKTLRQRYRQWRQRWKQSNRKKLEGMSTEQLLDSMRRDISNAKVARSGGATGKTAIRAAESAKVELEGREDFVAPSDWPTILLDLNELTGSMNRTFVEKRKDRYAASKERGNLSKLRRADRYSKSVKNTNTEQLLADNEEWDDTESDAPPLPARD